MSIHYNILPKEIWKIIIDLSKNFSCVFVSKEWAENVLSLLYFKRLKVVRLIKIMIEDPWVLESETCFEPWVRETYFKKKKTSIWTNSFNQWMLDESHQGFVYLDPSLRHVDEKCVENFLLEIEFDETIIFSKLKVPNFLQHPFTTNLSEKNIETDTGAKVKTTFAFYKTYNS